MTAFSIIGSGTMSAAITSVVLAGGNTVQVVSRDVEKAAAVAPEVSATAFGEALTGDVVVLALPYPALADIVSTYGDQLDGKIVIDITNPLDFSTFDSLVVPADSSAAAELAAQLPNAKVLKGFNTNFAATLASGKVGDDQTTVLLAGDDADAKATVVAALEGSQVRALDAGSLKRARELEALGFLQLTLAAAEKTSWTTGFALL